MEAVVDPGAVGVAGVGLAGPGLVADDAVGFLGGVPVVVVFGQVVGFAAQGEVVEFGFAAVFPGQGVVEFAVLPVGAAAQPAAGPVA